MIYCVRCGREVEKTASFCMYCGACLTGEETYVPLPRVPAEAPPAPARTVRGRRRLALLAGAVGCLTIAAAATLLILYLLSWRGAKSDDPLSLAYRYMRALEEKDVDSYLGCFAEGRFFSEDGLLRENMGVDPRKLLELGFHFMEVEFQDVGLKLERKGVHDASVVTTSGTLVVSVLGMKTETDLGEEPVRFRMTRQDGRWYLAEDPLPDLAVSRFFRGEGRTEIGPDDLGLPEFWNDFPEGNFPEGTDLEELEEWLRHMQEWLEEEVPEEVPEDIAA